MHCSVFNDRLRQQIDRSGRDHPAKHLVSGRQRQAFRDQIERWILELHSQDRGKIARKLSSAIHAWQGVEDTVHELVFGTMLRRAGIDCRYDRRLGLDECFLTPDWSCGKTTPKWISDVFTLHNRAPLNSEVQFRAALTALLEECEITRLINVTAVPRYQGMDATKSALEVLDWLDTSPCVGDEVTIGGVKVRVESEEHRGIIGSFAFWPDSPPRLRERLQEKIERYEVLTLPLAVAVFSDPFADVDEIDIEESLYGDEVRHSRID